MLPPTERAQPVSEQAEYKANMQGTLDLDILWKNPHYFPKGSKHPAGQAFARLPSAISAERVKERADNGNDFRAKSGCGTTMNRMEPRGQPHDTFEQIAWVPGSLKNAGIAPEKLTSFGAPWMMGLEPTKSRVAPLQYMFPGAGHCLHIVEGEAMVACWPLGPAIEKGGSATEEHVYFEAMDTKAFTAFANANFAHVVLKAGDTIWIPWGWHSAVVNKAGSRPLNALYVPWFNASLLKDVDIMVVRSLLTSLATWAERTTLTAIASQRPGIQSWLQTNNPTGEAVTAEPETIEEEEEEGGDDDEGEEEAEDEEDEGAAVGKEKPAVPEDGFEDTLVL